jgi:hypothetical protein
MRCARRPRRVAAARLALAQHAEAHARARSTCTTARATFGCAVVVRRAAEVEQDLVLGSELVQVHVIGPCRPLRRRTPIGVAVPVHVPHQRREPGRHGAVLPGDAAQRENDVRDLQTARALLHALSARGAEPQRVGPAGRAELRLAHQVPDDHRLRLHQSPGAGGGAHAALEARCRAPRSYALPRWSFSTSTSSSRMLALPSATGRTTAACVPTRVFGHHVTPSRPRSSRAAASRPSLDIQLCLRSGNPRELQRSSRCPDGSAAHSLNRLSVWTFVVVVAVGPLSVRRQPVTVPRRGRMRGDGLLRAPSTSSDHQDDGGYRIFSTSPGRAA